jgi:tetratricopeptide (TPR) repeat protein
MPVENALSRCDEIVRSVGNRRVEVSMLSSRSKLEAMRGRFDAAREAIAQATELADDLGLHAFLDTHLRPAAGTIELAAGDLAAAEELLRLACERTEELGELGFLSSITPDLIEAVYLQERYREAFELTERWPAERLTVKEDVDAQAGWRRVRGKVLSRLGEFQEAERVAREAVAISSSTDYLDLGARSLADLGEVLRLAGRPEEAAAALAEAVRLHEAKGNMVELRRLQALVADAAV